MSQELTIVPGSEYLPLLTNEQIRSRIERIRAFYQAVMVKGKDYGPVPGTDRPTLFKPGAEKLCTLFGFTPKLTLIEKVEDWTGMQHGGEPFFHYHYRVSLYRGDLLLAEAEGSCNSFESKYRWRDAQRTCPDCGKPAIIRGKQEFGGGFICFGKKGGCGAKFMEDDPAIITQQLGRVPNPDICDIVNTLCKMAQKRANVAAVLLATGASDFFTQDMADEDEQEEQERQGERRPAQEQRRSNSATSPAGARIINDSGGPCVACNAPDGAAHATSCKLTKEAARAA